MRILISNDDGYQAPGIVCLARRLGEVGEISVVAPERERSGASNSLTLRNPVRARRAENGFIYVDGTPTDCVHLAITGLLDPEPDLVVAGINAGANLGDDVLYSGTVAAAMPPRPPTPRPRAPRRPAWPTAPPRPPAAARASPRSPPPTPAARPR